MALPEKIHNLLRNPAAAGNPGSVQAAASPLDASTDAESPLVTMAQRVAAARKPNGRSSAGEHLPAINAGEDPNAALVRFAQALQAQRRQ